MANPVPFSQNGQLFSRIRVLPEPLPLPLKSDSDLPAGGVSFVYTGAPGSIAAAQFPCAGYSNGYSFYERHGVTFSAKMYPFSARMANGDPLVRSFAALLRPCFTAAHDSRPRFIALRASKAAEL